MIKKLLYTIMFILSILSIILLLFTPIYKFDDDKVAKYNTEIYATILDPTLTIYREKVDLNKMDDASKDEYLKNYKLLNEFALAIIEEDEEKFYNANRYEVLNAIYKYAIGAEGPLDPTSSNEKILLSHIFGIAIYSYLQHQK